ncbi:type VI secretion system protein TssA [Alkalimonas sp.]|uniref:type VI secretion system protein TssA n=1 Tax=Alkalimonas sp. TaxID=1872453 RepID=UPI00263A8E1E|nr:type VI secretion system protein TssA [Alkalimonas sp.]MCC5825380.1 type VI secretion system protein TssA [Alkalimonas sp.]
MIDCDFVKLDSIAKEIQSDARCGTDPRADVSPGSRYYQLKDKRRSLRDAERSALMSDDESAPMLSEWMQLAEDIFDALCTEAKDLEYAAWLIEALCRTSGFAGLARSFDCARVLIEKFWDDLYPQPDEDGLETRIAPLVGLNGYEGDGALISPILSVPLVVSASESSFATWQYIRANEQSRKEDSKKQRSEHSISLEAIVQIVAETPAEHFVTLLNNIDLAIAAFTELSTSMDSAMSGMPQPTSSILKAIQQCRDTVQYLAKNKLAAFHAEQEELLDEVSVDVVSGANNVSTVSKQVQTRQQVIQSLQDAADFFRKTEPHSPMSYALEQIIHWSGLALPELLQELIDDNTSRNQFFRLTGINKGSGS